jgi:hypothetical protein
MDLVITILLTVLFLLSLLLLFKSKKLLAKTRIFIIGVLIFFIVLASIALYKSSFKIKQRFMSGGGNNKRNKLLDTCKLPQNYDETSHCFNDSTHQTCCMLGPKARKYADSSGNPIGKAS